MLVTPRLYQQSQEQGKELWSAIREHWESPSSWYDLPQKTAKHVKRMRLVHQTGTVRVGEIVRYTLTYTPSHDRIVPTPSTLFVKIRNSSAVALRAAYLHGPYTLYAACYPATFDPNTKHESPDVYGQPQFESNLKAGGSWNAQLTIPGDIRETTLPTQSRRDSRSGARVTWVIEVSSQVLFSTSAAVHFELLVGRDEKSIDTGFVIMGGAPLSTPGQLIDHQESNRQNGDSAQTNGVYSDAIKLAVDDTASIWNKPELPGAKDEVKERERLRSIPAVEQGMGSKAASQDEHSKASDETPKLCDNMKKPKKVHLVLLSHGLHSNLGADMLYLKESIDFTAKQARLDKKMRRALTRKHSKTKANDLANDASPQDEEPAENTADSKDSEERSTGGQEDLDNDDNSDSDDEMVVVRGYPGNAVRTERGIQYLGKRLAKHVLAITYPDQPYLPTKKKSMGRSISNAFSSSSSKDKHLPGHASHSNSTIQKEKVPVTNLAYQFTSISFIGHSLGGLTQTYAIAYIQKHSPEFFQLIKPVNFVALATPFLGLSNENPLYVKFALDFGLVGRTGQDLGLTWRAPTMVRNGWGAMIAGIGTEGQRKPKQLNPGTKPLLRILPTGPAHQALRLFRNRTVYSNVVNDGIVPLRTSCLLFLDWKGLGRVEKARRENGLVGTMAGWGWAELTGLNSSGRGKPSRGWFDGDDSTEVSGAEDNHSTSSKRHQGDEVPQPTEEELNSDSKSVPSSPESRRLPSNDGKRFQDEEHEAKKGRASSPPDRMSNPLAGFFALLKPGSNSKSHHHPPKHTKIYKTSQTMKADQEDSNDVSGSIDGAASPRPGMARGDSALREDSIFAPPKTTVFEAAGDLLNPPLPDNEYLTDPSSRPRTIFHDRVYHPDDIPPPLAKPRSFLRRASSHDGKSSSRSTKSVDSLDSASTATSNMKVEEKIARAYHRDLSWRKVLVRLEPDAHNNIVVRRMFSNAYGWPVIKHLVDTHFADTYAALTADTYEPNVERARPMDEAVGEHGEEVKGQSKKRSASVDHRRTSEDRDQLASLSGPSASQHSSTNKPRLARNESEQWDDRYFSSGDEDDDEEYEAPRSPKPKPEQTELKEVSAAKRLAPLDTVNPMVAPVLTQSPTSEVGLRKSLEEQLESVRLNAP